MIQRTATSPPSDAPLVSVIVPTYNYGHFIGQTLESVCAQTYQNWECIVVDDGSTDDTFYVVARFADQDCRIKYVPQKNQRQPAALNTGVRNSSGAYVQFLDADDLIEAEKVARQVAYLESNSAVDIVYGGVRYFRTENMAERLFSMTEENKPWMPEASGQGKDILSVLTRVNLMAVNAPLLRRSVIDDVGFFDETIQVIHDWEYWVRCAAHGKRFQFENLAGTLALVRSHSASMSRNTVQMLRGTIRMRKKLARRIDDAGIRKLNRELIAVDAWNLGIEEVMRGELLKGMASLIEAGIVERRLNNRMKMFACALVSPFMSRQRFQTISSSSITDSVAGLWRKV